VMGKTLDRPDQVAVALRAPVAHSVRHIRYCRLRRWSCLHCRKLPTVELQPKQLSDRHSSTTRRLRS
jgi:hypothetical protein